MDRAAAPLFCYPSKGPDILGVTRRGGLLVVEAKRGHSLHDVSDSIDTVEKFVRRIRRQPDLTRFLRDEYQKHRGRQSDKTPVGRAQRYGCRLPTHADCIVVALLLGGFESPFSSWRELDAAVARIARWRHENAVQFPVHFIGAGIFAQAVSGPPRTVLPGFDTNEAAVGVRAWLIAD